jgi:quercetin dioxygenase-like cupin family protein
MLLALFLASAPAALPGPLEAGWQSKPVCEKLSEDDQLRVLRCTFAPGVGHDRHRHPRHWGYALSGGKMRITDAKGIRTAEIKAGSSFSSSGIEWHEVLNVGDTIVQYLIIEPR